MTDAPGRRWIARATTHFARTVYTELRRAGHAKGDIVRFINELMDLLAKDGGPGGTVEPPPLVDPEVGLPDRETMVDILRFELNRCQNDLRTGQVCAIAFDLVIPSWAPDTAHRHAHELLAAGIQRQLRRDDTLGKLGVDRYLLVAPFAKEGVARTLVARLQRTLDEIEAELPQGTNLVVRCLETTRLDADVHAVLARCFEQASLTIVPSRLADPPPARAAIPVHTNIEDIVLALGGGAARAASHAGVLHELAASRIRVAGVAGCSAGGLVGAMFARGMSPPTIVERFNQFAETPTFRDMRRAYATFVRDARNAILRRRSRYFGGTSMAFHSETALSAVPSELLFRFVEYFVGKDCEIQSLPVPFSVVATDLVEGRASVLSHGSLHSALAATCALPGLFPPQQVGDRLLVDGSAVAELPVWAGHLLGVHAPVLAIHLERPWQRVTDYQCSTEVATRSNALAHAELVREQLRHTEYLLTIRVEEVGWLDFRHAGRLFELGRAAAHEGLPQLLEKMVRARRPQQPALDA